LSKSSESSTILITGASGFIGGAVTERLLQDTQRKTQVREIRGLTSHPAKGRFGNQVRSFLYDFEQPRRMREAFDGVDIFVNSYYVRFDHGGLTFEDAVERSRALVSLARAAEVRKIVHISVTNASEQSNLRYYSNKARIERLVRESGLDYSILRPALVAGPGDILINNIAYFLRRLPVFTIFGTGEYRVQPILLDAFAETIVDAIEGSYRQETVAVAGPRDWTFISLVRAIRSAIGSRAALTRAPAAASLASLWIAGVFLRDVVLTSDEVKGLTREYLYESQPVRVGADVADWLAMPTTRETLGRQYASELARHFR
jgi:uncharacterized protein YbjT (DUF2867 family)